MHVGLLLRKQTVRQASVLLVATTIIVKLLGFAREAITARGFGVSAEYDTFLVVFSFPALVNATLSYAIPYAVTPHYQKLRVAVGEGPSRRYFWRLTAVVSIVLMAIAVGLGQVASPAIALLVPSASGLEHVVAVRMFRVLSFLLPLFFGLTALQTLLRAEGYFLVCTAGILSFNITIIAFIVAGSQLGVFSLVWGWVAGASVQLAWLVVAITFYSHKSAKKETSRQRLQSGWIRSLGMALLLVVLVEIWTQLFVVFDRLIAQYFVLPEGRVAALGYATTMNGMPVSIFALSIGQAVLPFLSTYVAAGQSDALFTVISKAIRSAILIIVPIFAVFLVLSEPIIGLVYQRGAFDSAATGLTARALRLYSLGLPFSTVFAILVGYFYASGKFGILIGSAVTAFVIKVVMALALVPFWGYLALAVSTSLAILVKTLILSIQLRQEPFWVNRSMGTLELTRNTIVAILPGTLLSLALLRPISTTVHETFSNQTIANMTIFFLFSVLILVSYLMVMTMQNVPEWQRVRAVFNEVLASIPTRIRRP